MASWMNVNRYDMGIEAEQLEEEYYALDEMIASAETLREELNDYWNEYKVSLEYSSEVEELIRSMKNRQEEIRDKMGEIVAHAPVEHGEI